MTNSFCWPSPAKLNLFLYITGQRADGYHQLQTLFQFLDVGDTLTINIPTSSQITIAPDIENLLPQDNLIYKAAMALRTLAAKHDLPTNIGAHITIDKILPMGGGLGGGSSNAATTLVALNQMWQYHFSVDELADIGLSLGADVPVFVRGHAAFAEGVGEQLTAVTPEEKWYVVIKPNTHIATQAIFTHPELTRNTPKRSFSELVDAPYHNDCQKIVTSLYPEVAQELSWLLQYAPSRLTGTGACVFAQLDTKQEAQTLFNRFRERNGLEDNGQNRAPKQGQQKQEPQDNGSIADKEQLEKNKENTVYKTTVFKKNSVLGFIAKGVNVSPLYKTLADYKQLVNNP